MYTKPAGNKATLVPVTPFSAEWFLCAVFATVEANLCATVRQCHDSSAGEHNRTRPCQLYKLDMIIA